MAIGAVLCLSNTYIVLKTGWSLGVTLTSSVVAFGVFRALGAAGLVKERLSVHENVMVGSVGSAAAFMTGGGNMAALPALLMLTGTRPSGVWLFSWFATIAALGVFAAIPIKRRIIDEEKLPFPSSQATAATLRAMHGDPARAGAAPRLFKAAGVAALFVVLRDLRALPWRLPSQLRLPFTLGGHPLADWTLSLDASLVLVGGGAFMTMRTAWSLVLGALIAYGVVAPALATAGVIQTVAYKSIVEVTLWPGAALLVGSGVATLALQWRVVARSFLSLRPAHGGGGPDEAPSWWFAAGALALAPVAVALMVWLFAIPWWAAVLAIPLALAMGVIAARVTGETDVTPTKALGPATQLLYGLAVPSNVTANVMSANVTGGVGLHAADLLSDIKVGAILGASPRAQVRAQLFGVLVGAAIVAPAFALLVPSAAAIGTAELPAPAVLVWASVSKVLAGGLGGLSHVARVGIAAGGAAGVALAVLERALPQRARAWVPSPSGLGIAMIMPASSSLAMFLGAALAAIARRARPNVDERLVPIASGLVAGESLAGVTFALLRAAGFSV